MNDAKLTKWNQFLRSNFIQAICISLFTGLIVKAIEKYGDINLMKSLFQTFFIELWPVWFGIGVGLAYLAICRIVLINNFLRKGLKFDEKLDALSVERRELMTHVHNSYNGLSRRIDKIEKRAPHI